VADEQAGYYLGWVPTCHTLSFRVPNWNQKERNTITLFILKPHMRQASVKNYWQNERLSSYSINISGALDTGHAVIRSVGNIFSLSGAFRNEILVSSCVYMQQDRQWTYNITLRRVRATTVAAEKQLGIAHSECIFVALGIKHATRHITCGLSCSITFFPHYLINGTIFEKKSYWK